MEMKNNRHACYKLEYYLIVVTKYRKKLINNYKTVTSRLIRKKYLTYLKQFYYTNKLFWSDSYYIGSISDTTEDIVKRYINNQGKSKNKCG